MANSTSSKFRFWLITAVVCGLLVAPILIAYFATAGIVFGEEFSPDDFSRRRFSYNVTPLFRFTIQGIAYENSTPPLEQTLITNQLITPTQAAMNQQQSWHLISESGTDENLSDDFDARILCNYLDMVNRDNENFWMVWNEDFPATSQILWPAVAELARHKLYWAIPAIMDPAIEQMKDDAGEFRALVDRSLALAFFQEGLSSQQHDKHQRAVILFDRSLEFENRPATLQARQDSMHRLDGMAEMTDSDDANSRPQSPQPDNVRN